MVATVSNIRPDWAAVEDSSLVPLPALPFPAATVDGSGVLSAANPEWSDAFPGATPGTRIFEWLDAVHQPVPGLRAAVQDVLTGRRPRAAHRDGRHRFTISSLRGGALILRQDVEEPLEDIATTSQSRKMETVGRLTGGVAHDFANLLTLIAGYSDLLLNRVGDRDPLRPELIEIREAANRGSHLTSQLLGYTRGQPSQPRVLDLNVVINDIRRMLRPIIGEDIEFELSLSSGTAEVVADPGQMEQVIMNLLLNARDAMPTGGRIRIETAIVDWNAQGAAGHGMQPGPCVLLSIGDTGYGIEPAALQHVFEPFFTTKEKGKGTGIGLHTVHRIIKESGGDIWVRSEPSCGATFSICLPRAQQPPANDAEPAAATRQPNSGNETILLVEDEEGVRRLLTHVLHKRGYRVIEACDGEEGLRIFQQKAAEIHLVLTDMVMPRMSGRQMAERLLQQCPEMKVMFMSGYTDDVLVRTGALSPGMPFLQKPLRPEVLAARVRESLDSPARPFNPR